MKDSETRQTQAPSVPSALSGLDFVFDLVREQFAIQREYASSLDNKAGIILGSTSILTAVLLVVQVPSLKNAVFSLQSVGEFLLSLLVNYEVFLPFIAIMIYLSLVLTSFRAYGIYNYQQVPEPNQLYASYMAKPEEVTKSVVLKTILDAYNHNEKLLRRKIVWTKWAFRALWAEALIVAVILTVKNIH